MRTLVRHFQPVIENIVRGRWLKGNRWKLDAPFVPSYDPLATNGLIPLIPNIPLGTIPTHNVGEYFMGGTPPVTYSVSAGTPPAGITLDTFTGQLGGRYTALGGFDCTVQAKDGTGATATQQWTGTVVLP